MRQNPTRRWLLGATLLGAGALAAGCGPTAAALPVHGRKTLWRRPFPFAGGTDDSFGPKLVTASPGLVVAGHGGKLYAFDPATGKPRWSSPNGPYDEQGTVRAPAIITGEVVLTLSNTEQQTTLFALDAATGKKRWQAAGVSGAAPAASGDLVYLATPGHLTAFDSATGRVRWRHPATGPATVQPVVSGSTVYAADGAHLTALRASGGHARWLRPLGPAGLFAGPSALYALTDRLTVLDPHTGRTRSSTRKLDVLRQGARDITLAEGTLYLANTGGEPSDLWAVDATTGGTRWTFTGAKAIQGPVSTSTTTVYVGDATGHLHALDSRTGHPVWTLTTTAPVDPPTATRTTVYAIIAPAPDVDDPVDHLYALQA